MVLKDRRLLHIDIIRIVSCFSVIAIHIISYDFGEILLTSRYWMFLNIFDSFLRWCVPVFFMISGSLNLSKEQENDNVFYLTKMLRIIINFFAWSILYCLLFVKDPNIFARIKIIISGYYHLWFLYSISFLYFITPFLRRIIIYKKKTISLMIIMVLASITIKPIVLHLNNTFLNFLIDRFDPCYVFFYLFGYYFRKWGITKRYTKLIYCFGILSFIFTFMSTLFLSRKNGISSFLFYEYTNLNIVLFSIAVYIFLTNIFQRYHVNDKKEEAILILSKSCYCVYLIHVMILEYLYNFALFDIIGFILIRVSVVFILSFVCSLLLKKIPIINIIFL